MATLNDHFGSGLGNGRNRVANKHIQSVDEQIEPQVRGISGDGGGDDFGERLA